MNLSTSMKACPSRRRGNHVKSLNICFLDEKVSTPSAAMLVFLIVFYKLKVDFDFRAKCYHFGTEPFLFANGFYSSVRVHSFFFIRMLFFGFSLKFS